MDLDLEQLAPERVRPLRRAEYDKLVDLGVFDDEKIELLYGVLVTMSPQGTEHSEVIRRLNRLLVLALHDRGVVAPQLPFAASDDSEPEPDLAVLPPGDCARAHPERALLVVEVANTSVRKDRIIKAKLYAAAGVPEYWLVDLKADVIEVYRDPRDGRYASFERRSRQDTIASAHFPDIELRVADVLPSLPG